MFFCIRLLFAINFNVKYNCVMDSDGSLDDRGLNVKTTISYINTALNGGCFHCAAKSREQRTCFKANDMLHGLFYSKVRSPHKKGVS